MSTEETPTRREQGPIQETPAESHGRMWRTLKTVMGERRFATAALVLLVAAAGLNWTVQRLQVHFKKEPVPMRLGPGSFVKGMPTILGDWVQMAREDVLDPDVQRELGTDEFLFCIYVNAKALKRSAQELEKDYVTGKTYTEQKTQVAEFRRRNATAVLSVALTYYTGSADTVAHIPERCMSADGLEPINPQTETWDWREKDDSGNLVGHPPVPIRHITFEGETKWPQNVAYLFHVNGHYESNSLRVRLALQNLFARHGYYAKVELNCVTPDSKEQTVNASKAAMRDFLKSALPAVENVLPDWSLYEPSR